MSTGSHLAGAPRVPPFTSPTPTVHPCEEHPEGGRGQREQLTGSSIPGYMLGTSVSLKLFPDWEGAGGVRRGQGLF